MNKVFLIGNLTRDPELTETASGVPVCHFAIAVNRNYSSQDGERQTDFFNCTAWRAMAETIARYTKKGKKVFKFRVMLSPETEIKAVADDCQDTAVICRVNKPNLNYKLKKNGGNGGNWV